MNFDQRIQSSIRVPILAAACLVAFSGQAVAQNALGDGRGLEANPRQGSDGRNYQSPSLAAQVRFRNAISTGNAPGGLSFRGDLGYQAPGEFAGALGSDALYSFRRDSLYSGLAGMGIRGTDALQYQFSMTTGADMTRNLVGTGLVSRYDGASSGSLPGGITGIGESLAVDPLSQFRGSGTSSGTLRSTSSYSSTSSMVPELVSVFESGIERNRFGVVSTPLMGLVSTRLQSERDPTSRTNQAAPAMTSYDDTIKMLQDRAKTLRESKKLESELETDGKTPEELEQENNDWIAERLGKLQRQVLGAPDPVEQGDPDAGVVEVDPVDGTEDPVKIVDPVNPDLGDGNRVNDGRTPEIGFDRGAAMSEGVRDGTGAGAGLLYQIDPETLEVFRGDGNRVTYLVDPNASDRDPYAEHMSAGERLLSSGRYFDAEERFAYAMSIRPGNVSAQLGRMHAQIGAGLVLSASVNLQGLLTERIEIVSNRYSGDLLPSEDRIRELIFILRERGGLEERPSYVPIEPVEVRVACGLLMSYLGYQIGDETEMNTGFALVREHGTNPDVRLVRLLEQVWGLILDESGPGIDTPADQTDGEGEPAP